MAENKSIIDAAATANSGTAFETNYYWSSSEANSTGAWVIYFDEASAAENYGKNSDFYVRAVRAF